MGFSPDRLKAAFFALFRASVPRLDYYGKYVAKVVAESDDGFVDLVALDPRIPPMARVPLWHGLPGATVVIPAGTMVFVGWSGADPSDVHCELFPDAGPAIQITLKADKVFLGGTDQELITIQDGALTGQAIDSYTGLQQWQLGNASSVVMLKKT